MTTDQTIYDQYPVSESPAMQSVLRGIEQAAAGEYQPDPTKQQLPPTEFFYDIAMKRSAEIKTQPEQSGRCNYCGRSICPVCKR